MSNILFFWMESYDPPSPWTRLTRQGKYIRLTDSAANHLATIGATTHNHDNEVASFSIGNCPAYSLVVEGAYYAEGIHNHSNPSSYAITSANNDPAYYGLDLIYMDFAVWKASYRTIPYGAVVLSAQALSESPNLARFTTADGKYILNTTPGTEGGSTGTRSHTVTATTASGGTGIAAASGSNLKNQLSHTHTISLTSGGNTNEPRNLTTRLYEVLSLILAAKADMVAFCDGTPDEDWEILSGWKDANLKSGDSDPTLSGSDTHNETVSGNTNPNTGSNNRSSGTEGQSGVKVDHVHPVSGTFKTVSHIPESCYLMPIRLTKSYSLSRPRAQIIGAW
jgi:hypothetical protein